VPARAESGGRCRSREVALSARAVGVVRLGSAASRPFSGAMSRPAGPRRWQPGRSARTAGSLTASKQICPSGSRCTARDRRHRVFARRVALRQPGGIAHPRISHSSRHLQCRAASGEGAHGLDRSRLAKYCQRRTNPPWGQHPPTRHDAGHHRAQRLGGRHRPHHSRRCRQRHGGRWPRPPNPWQCRRSIRSAARVWGGPPTCGRRWRRTGTT